MRERLSKLANLLELRDVLAFGGLGVMCYGLHLVYPPAAYIAGGAVMLWLGAGR
jgi:hypothetical protein